MKREGGGGGVREQKHFQVAKLIRMVDLCHYTLLYAHQD